MSTVFIILRLSSLYIDIIFFFNLTGFPLYPGKINKTQMNIFHVGFVSYRARSEGGAMKN